MKNFLVLALVALAVGGCASGPGQMMPRIDFTGFGVTLGVNSADPVNAVNETVVVPVTDALGVTTPAK